MEDHSKIGQPVKWITGWSRFLPIYALRSHGRWHVRIFPAKLLAWVIALAAGGYLAAGIGLYANDRFRNHLTNISLWDRLYPPHWDRYRIARGDSLISNANRALAHGQFSNAVHLLRSGLARNPDNLAGRQLLADLYRAAKRDDLAEAVLVAGLADAYRPALRPLLDRTIAFLFQKQRDTAIIDLTTHLLAQPGSLSAEVSTFLVLAQSNALFYRGNFDQAEDLIRQFALQRLPAARKLAARMEWYRGFKPLAINLINQLATEFPADQEVYQLRIAWLAESGETDRARQISLLRRIEHPEEIRARLDFLIALDRAKDNEAVHAESLALLQQFRDQPEAALMLGDFAANSGRPDIAKLAFDHAAAAGNPTSGLALMRVESLIVSERYREAVELTRELLDENPEWKSTLAPVFNGLQAIAHFALGDRESADLYLNDFFDQRDLRAENLVAVATRLRTVGALAQAHLVLVHAVQLDPLNQPALSSLIALELQTPGTNQSELANHLRRLLTMRRPSPEILHQAYQQLGRDRFVFLADREALLNDLGQVLAGRPPLSG